MKDEAGDVDKKFQKISQTLCYQGQWVLAFHSLSLSSLYNKGSLLIFKMIRTFCLDFTSLFRICPGAPK